MSFIINNLSYLIGNVYSSLVHDNVPEGIFHRTIGWGNSLGLGGRVAYSVQREGWYDKTRLIAEFWCTITNLPIIVSGSLTGVRAVILTGIASTLYHVTANRVLVVFDQFGVASIIGRAGLDYKIIRKHPECLIFPAGAIGLMILDERFSQTGWATLFHSAWHTGAGVLGYFYFKYLENKRISALLQRALPAIVLNNLNQQQLTQQISELAQEEISSISKLAHHYIPFLVENQVDRLTKITVQELNRLNDKKIEQFGIDPTVFHSWKKSLAS